MNDMKIGEVRRYSGVYLECIKQGDTCDGCFFYNKETYDCERDLEVSAIVGHCGRYTREDETNVAFVKATEKAAKDKF